ncbi:MAG: pirin-like C-terminal cupin domain-containing protein [Balneolaceae bacterium]
MSLQRKVVQVQTPPEQQGFLGPGHTARPVVQGDFFDTDPFIVLMDDMLDKQDEDPVGGAHPHAGFETVSLLLEGEMGDSAHKMQAGDFQIMTAGSGIIHTETIDTKARMRLLQLWLTLPQKDRWTTPKVQNLPKSHVPTLSEEGLEINVYSGSLAGLQSPIQNHVPIIVSDVRMQSNTETILQLPASYTSFLYVIEGGVMAGENQKPILQDEVGWLDRLSDVGESELKLTAGNSGVRVILYSGLPQGETIASHGPFIGNTQEDIQRLYKQFKEGKMQHISTVPGKHQITW